MPLNLSIPLLGRRFDVDPAEPRRVVIMEGEQVTADLGVAKDVILATAIAEFLARALDVRDEREPPEHQAKGS